MWLRQIVSKAIPLQRFQVGVEESRIQVLAAVELLIIKFWLNIDNHTKPKI
jgi:hypothetical protein